MNTETTVGAKKRKYNLSESLNNFFGRKCVAFMLRLCGSYFQWSAPEAVYRVKLLGHCTLGKSRVILAK